MIADEEVARAEVQVEIVEREQQHRRVDELVVRRGGPVPVEVDVDERLLERDVDAAADEAEEVDGRVVGRAPAHRRREVDVERRRSDRVRRLVVVVVVGREVQVGIVRGAAVELDRERAGVDRDAGDPDQRGLDGGLDGERTCGQSPSR